MNDRQVHEYGGEARGPLPLNEWLHRMMQKKFLILVPMVLSLIVFTAVILSMRTEYTATTTVMIEGQINRVVNVEDVAARVRGTDEALAGEVHVFYSTDLARAVIERLDLRNHPQFAPPAEEQGPPPGPVTEAVADVKAFVGDRLADAKAFARGVFGSGPAPLAAPDRPPDLLAPASPSDEPLIKAFQRGLTVKPAGQSHVLSVSYTADTSALAAKAANAVAEEYLALREGLKTKIATETAEWLKDRIDRQREQVIASERRADEFRRSRGIMDETLIQSRLTDLNSLIIAAEAQYEMLLDREETAKEMLEQGDPLALVEAVGTSDLRSGGIQTGTDQAAVPTLQELRTRVIAARQTERDMATQYGNQHPRMREAANARRTAEAALASEVRSFVSSIEGRTRLAKRNLEQLEQSMAALESASMEAQEKAVDLASLERDRVVNQDLYEQALGRYREIENLALERADGWIVSPALIPGAPSNPAARDLMLVAFVFSLGIGLVVFAISEVAAGGINDATQIPGLFGTRHLSTIPKCRTGWFQRKPPADYVLKKPSSAFAEGLNNLAIAMDLFSPTRRGRVVCLTSCREGEGKSMTTLSLARLIAVQTQKRVLAVECDLRKRTMGRYMKRSGCGLGEYLDGVHKLEECLHKDSESGAHFLFAGSSSRSPQNILASNGFRDLLLGFRQHYDLIILDTPPLIEIADTRLVSSMADQVVLLAKWRSTTRAAVARAVEQLRDQDSVLAGIALTQVDLKRYREYSMNSTFSYSGSYYSA